MDVAEALTALGGVAGRRDLVAATSRGALARALESGAVIRRSRGTYVLPGAQDAVAAARSIGGTLCLTSAALHHGWAVKRVPERPHVSVRRGRRVSPERRREVELHRFDLGPHDVDGVATSREATLTQCLRSLPFDEALCIADSAARRGERALLVRVARTARGAGAARIRHLIGLARADAANPFESCLRAITLDVPGLDVVPQVWVAEDIRPDLVDRRRRIILEAESFTWHGDRAALRRDARRYDLLVVEGWIVLRFSWEDVMFDPDYVRRVLVRAVALSQRHTEVPCGRCRAA